MQANPRAQELEQAFAAFNQHSLQLGHAYGELKARVAELTGQLAAAHSERLRELAEKERLASRLEELHALLPGGLLVLDGQGVICEHNPAALALLGEPLLGANWRDVMQRSCRTEADGELVLASGRRVSVTRRRMPSEPGQILLLTDVTETRDLQSLVARNQRLSAMGEMAARLAHQIRTPLSSAVLYTSQLTHPSIDADRCARFAGKTLDRLRQLERMVNDMLMFAGGGNSDAAPIAPGRLLEDVAQMLEPQREGQGRLHIDADPQLREFHGNYEALVGALGNLATNALQAAGADVRLTLSARRGANGAVELAVRDNGPGFAADAAEQIFAPFYTTRPGGTGLGLAVVRSVARAHGGDAWATNAEGGGAIVGMTLLPPGDVDALPSGAAACERIPADTNPIMTGTRG